MHMSACLVGTPDIVWLTEKITMFWEVKFPGGWGGGRETRLSKRYYRIICRKIFCFFNPINLKGRKSTYSSAINIIFPSDEKFFLYDHSYLLTNLKCTLPVFWNRQYEKNLIYYFFCLLTNFSMQISCFLKQTIWSTFLLHYLFCLLINLQYILPVFWNRQYN